MPLKSEVIVVQGNSSQQHPGPRRKEKQVGAVFVCWVQVKGKIVEGGKATTTTTKIPSKEGKKERRRKLQLA